MPIAKEILRVGNTVAALPGNYVSPSAVEANGWQDQVDSKSGPDIVLDANESAEDTTTKKSKAASK